MEIRRLFDILDFQLENSPKQDALAAKVDGKWIKYGTAEIIELVNQLSTGLRALGINKGDKVALSSFNRPEWVIVDYAILQIGAISVPMYPNSTPQDYAFILNHAEAKVVFSGDQQILQKLKVAKKAITQQIEIFSFDLHEDAVHWKHLLKPVTQEDQSSISKIRSTIAYDDLATIIYTSGTTGNPKGVMLSHKNILSNAFAVEKSFPVKGSGYKALSFLPLSHIFARTALYTYMKMGVSIYYAESMETIGENLKEVKPDFFASVPRLLEKVYEKIVSKGYEQKGVKKQLFFWALELAQKFQLGQKQNMWFKLQLKLANKIIFNKWREAIGGNVQFVISGGAALQPRIANIFWAAGIKILEAYGLTETSPGVSFSRIDNVRIGCVGTLLDGVEVKIAEDGEILVRGDNVMMGYYKDPATTSEVLDQDNWFHTGDIGELLEGKFLKITDRKKEIFKTSGGKYIAPQVLENKLSESLLIDQVMIVGEGQKFAAALIVPNFEKLKDWCERHEIKYTSDAEMIHHSEVINKFQEEVHNVNGKFAQYEQVKKFNLLPVAWTIDNGEMTPKLSLKRKIIKAHFHQEIAMMYEKSVVI